MTQDRIVSRCGCCGYHQPGNHDAACPFRGPDHPGGPLLTDEEIEFVRSAGQLWNLLCALVPAGPTREADLGEAVVHIHALQHMVMAQAAARAYPTLFRELGRTVRQ